MVYADNYPRHIVAACALVTNAAGDVLMIRSPRRGWEVPGGQIEEGEALLDGLRREILEETGVTAAIGAMASVCSSISEPCKVIFSFLATYVAGDPQTSPESPEVAWVARDEALNCVTHPTIQDRVRDLLEYDGRAIYRVYSMQPYHVISEQHI